MESLLCQGFALHTRCSATAILPPATRVTFFGRSVAPLSRPLMRWRSVRLSPASTSRISALARNRSLKSKSMQINRGEFTQMAWEAIIGAVDAARTSKQQVVETEHLMKALLEQKDGLARRIFTKAGVDNTTILQATYQFISSQQKIVGDTSWPIVGQNLVYLGQNLVYLLDTSHKYKKEFSDDFLLVEHLILALFSDKRFGQQLFKKHWFE